MAGNTVTVSTESEEESSNQSSAVQIQVLKETFGDQVKVIQDIGDFTYVATVKFHDKNLAIKFQVQDGYPTKPAQIVVQSNKLSPEEQTNLRKYIDDSVQASLLDTVKYITDWIHENEINLEVDDTPGKRTETRKPKKHKKIAVKDEVISGKAPSMKTAEDVIHRILWDENLPTENFVIGYVDRFLGIVEKPFILFSWEDLASVDYDVLAIPKHRIQYFKYKSHTIWDKSTRCDHMFGSTGSNFDIFEVMKQADSEEEKINQAKATYYSDSDDSDDDIDINTGCSAQFGDVASTNPDETTSEGHLYPREKYWGAKIRPTHFLALRITDPDIKCKVKEVQEAILDLEPEYAKCIIPPERLHITLACLGLDTEEEVQRAVDTLHKLKGELQDKNDPKIKVHLQNLDHFFNNTLYASVGPSENMITFVDHLKLVFTESGVSLRDIFDFVPHMTLLKLSMQIGREMNTRYLDPRISQIFGQTDFGSQMFDNIHLCSMLDEKDSDGFYKCPTHINFE